jgi:hypothetical protein
MYVDFLKKSKKQLVFMLKMPIFAALFTAFTRVSEWIAGPLSSAG